MPNQSPEDKTNHERDKLISECIQQLLVDL